MSTPSQPAGQRQPARQQAQQASQPAQQQSQPAQQAGQTQQTAQPARQAGQPARQGPAATSSWSTPRLLRLARAGAAAAVLLTGVAATGTFSTGGLNSTPDVIAQDWVAAERAGVEMAHADLRAAERVADGDPDGARESFDEAVTQVGTDLTSLGADRAQSAEVAREWSTFVLAAERAATASAQAEEDPGAAAGSDYGTATGAARSAAERTDAVAEQHAQDLRTGSRSVLTGVVGTVSTLGLIGLLVWLALRTRRIVNVPLLVATAITGGLTYLSINPSAIPLTYDQRLEETTATATALQEVYQARAGQHAVALGLSPSSPEDVDEARAAIEELDAPQISQAWATVQTAHDEILAGDGVGDAEEAAGLVSSTQEAFQTVESDLRERLDERLGEAGSDVGLPAGITSGAALLLGLVGAVFAWTGLSRRLQEYR